MRSERVALLLACLCLLGMVPANMAGTYVPKYLAEDTLAPLLRTLDRTSQATVYQIGGVWDWPASGMPDTAGVVAGYVVLRSHPAPSATWIDSLKAVLGNPMTYSQDPSLCVTTPGYVVRLRGVADSVTAIISAGCSRVDVRSTGRPQFGGWAYSTLGEISSLMRSALPPAVLARSSAEGMSAPHNYRDRDCRCTIGEQEYYYYERPPIAIHSPAPTLPDGVSSASTQRVKLQVLVDDQGRPCRIMAASGSDPYALLAVQALQTWRWKPAMSEGKALCVWIEVPIEFGPR